MMISLKCTFLFSEIVGLEIERDRKKEKLKLLSKLNERLRFFFSFDENLLFFLLRNIM